MANYIRVPKIKYVHKKAEKNIAFVIKKFWKNDSNKLQDILDNYLVPFYLKYKQKHGKESIRDKPYHYNYIFERYLRMYYK